MRSYRPEELFDATGAPVAGHRSTCTRPAPRRMSANPHANGGLLLQDLRLPDFREYAVPVEHPGTGAVEATRVLGHLPARRDGPQRRPVPRLLARTRTTPTASRTSSRSPTGPGTPRPSPTTTTSPPTAG